MTETVCSNRLGGSTAAGSRGWACVAEAPILPPRINKHWGLFLACTLLQFSELYHLLDETEGPYTIFAPTNEGFVTSLTPFEATVDDFITGDAAAEEHTATVSFVSGTPDGRGRLGMPRR